MGDFNSHSPSWGYDDLDHKGDEVEDLDHHTQYGTHQQG